MTKIIPYNAIPIPELLPEPSVVGPHFAAMRRLELPGILFPAINCEAVDSEEAIQSILAATGLTVHRNIPLITSRQHDADQPAHIDAIPADYPSVGAVVQHTRAGSADIILAKLARPFCDELTRRNAHLDPSDSRISYDLPPHTDQLLDEGYVDPEVLQPDIHIGSVATGGVIMFAFGGPQPIAHRFRSTSAEREAQGYIVPFTRL